MVSDSDMTDSDLDSSLQKPDFAHHYTVKITSLRWQVEGSTTFNIPLALLMMMMMKNIYLVLSFLQK